MQNMNAGLRGCGMCDPIILPSGDGRGEHIADTSDCFYQFGLGWIVFDFLAQSGNECIDRAIERIAFAAPQQVQ